MLWPCVLLRVLSNNAGIIAERSGNWIQFQKIIGHVTDQALSKLTEESSAYQDPGDA
jgi:hypothetical protein